MSAEIEPRPFSSGGLSVMAEREAVNAVEEYMIGSTCLPEGANEPLKVLGAFQEEDVEELNAMRQELTWFATIMAYEIEGLKGVNQIALFRFVELDSDGVARGFPKLYGIYDKRTQEIDTSEETLSKHELCFEKWAKILEEIAAN